MEQFFFFNVSINTLLLDNIDIILFENGTDAEANSTTKSTVERWEDVSTVHIIC